MLSSIIQLTNVVSSDKIQQTHLYTKSEHIVNIMQCSVKTTSESIPSRALFRNRTEIEKIKVIKELPTISFDPVSLFGSSYQYLPVFLYTTIKFQFFKTLTINYYIFTKFSGRILFKLYALYFCLSWPRISCSPTTFPVLIASIVITK